MNLIERYKKNALKYRQINNGYIYHMNNEGHFAASKLSIDNVEWKNGNYKNFPIENIIFFSNDYLFIPFARGTTALNIHNGKEEIIAKKGIKFRPETLNNDKIIFTSYREKKIGQFNITTNTIEWERVNPERPWLKVISNENIAITIRSSKIYCFNRLNGVEIWNTDLSRLTSLNYIDYTGDKQKGDIKKIIGIKDDKLFLSVNNDAIICLYTSNGKIFQIKSKLGNYYWSNGNHLLGTIPSPSNAKFMKNKIVGLANYTFWEWDIIKDEFYLKDCEADFRANNVFADYNIPYLKKNNYLIFNSSPNKLVFFNSENKVIEFVYKANLEEDNAFWPDTISLDSNWLIINDYKKNTYIFEITN